MRRLVLYGLVVALVVPAAAWAHATLKSEFPGFQQELRVGPKFVRLHFGDGRRRRRAGHRGDRCRIRRLWPRFQGG